MMTFIAICLLGLAFAANDREYCGFTYSTSDYYSSAGSGGGTSATTLVPTFTQGHRAGASIISMVDGTVYLDKATTSGIFKEGNSVITGEFCFSGMVFSADINGDDKDDLLCHASGAGMNFSVRYYSHSGLYADEKPLDQSLVCDTSVSSKILIGDFNGDNADDVMCLDVYTSKVGPTSWIYFNTPCQSATAPNRKKNFGGQRTNPFSAGIGSSRRADGRCSNNGPVKYLFEAGDLAGCNAMADDIFTLNVNDDGTTDLMCRQSGTGHVRYFLSNGATGNGVFDTLIEPSVALTCAETLIAADVDGDGDHDLVCVNSLSNTPTQNFIAFFSAGAYQAFATSYVGTSCQAVCSDGGSGSSVEYIVGDFNNDGYDDYMCRWDDGGYKTGFYYSVAQ